MNDPFGNNPTQNPGQMPSSQPVSPSGWAPQSSAPAPAPMASSPFESSQIPNITGPDSSQGNGPVMMEPAGPKNNTWLYIILAVLVVGGIIFLASMMGWLDLKKFLGMGSNNTQVEPTPTPTIVVNKNDATRKTDLANLKTALNTYFSNKQAYPISVSLSKTSDPDSPLKVLVPEYIASLPIDPLSPNSFYGYRSGDGKSFELTAVLEDQTDTAGIMEGNIFLYKVTNASAETPSTSNPQSNASTEPVVEPVVVPDTGMEASVESESSSSSSSSSADASADASAF